MHPQPHFKTLLKLSTVAVVLSLGLLFGLSALAVNGQAVAAPAVQATATLVGAQAVGAKGGVFNCGGWTVEVPANVVPDGGLIHCGAFNPDKAPAGPTGYTLLRHTINVNIYDNKGQWITNFNPPLTFCYPYNDAELLAAGGDVRNFNVLTAPINGIWSVLLPSVTPGTKQVCARTNHLTLFDLAVSGSPVSNPFPVATAGPASAATTSSTTTYLTFAYSYKHVVQRGDTLFHIALTYKTSVYAIQLANNLPSTYIYVGQVLLIPTNTAYTGTIVAAPTQSFLVKATATSVGTRPQTYTVKAGDNLFRIALKYNTTVVAIQAANGLTSTYIYVGQVLIIPNK
jgi:LysM repeat protein